MKVIPSHKLLTLLEQIFLLMSHVGMFLFCKFMLDLGFYSSCGMPDVVVVSVLAHSCEIGYAIGNVWSRVRYGLVINYFQWWGVGFNFVPLGFISPMEGVRSCCCWCSGTFMVRSKP